MQTRSGTALQVVRAVLLDVVRPEDEKPGRAMALDPLAARAAARAGDTGALPDA